MLNFHKIALEEISQENGSGTLMIMSRGLGLEKIINSIITIYAQPSSLVLILNNNQFESLSMKKALEEAKLLISTKDLIINPDYFQEIDAEINAKDRASLYLKGGVLVVSSRILVVDMLNKVVPVDKIRGIIVNHAHNVSDTSPITFILRLFRQGNKVGFIRAFSDNPDYFCNDSSKLERMMKALQVRFLALWPRFQLNIRKDIEDKGTIELIELRIPYSKKMKAIQNGLIECLNQMLLELKRLHPSIDKEELKLEKSFSRSFDLILRSQLDGIWQNASSKTKGLVSDLRTVRLLLDYVAQYDAVSFYEYLETERQSVAASMKSTFKQSTFTWLHLDAANIAFAEGRKRVLLKNPDAPQTDPNIPKGYQICVEEQPKWRALIQVLCEIVKERKENYEDRGSVLVVCRGGKTCDQLRRIIAKTNLNACPKTSSSSDFTSPGTKSILMDQLYEYFQWKGGMANISKTLKLTGSDAAVSTEPSTKIPPSGAPTSKRRRIRPGTIEGVLSKTGEQSFEEEATAIAKSISYSESVSNSRPVPNNYSYITIRAYSGFNYDSNYENPDSTILDCLTPQWIVIYDPDIAFVRRIEIYKAENTDRHLKVFFLVYDNSSEEQQYLTNLRREKESFEKLILQKSV